MTNYCSNRLRISGTPSDIAAFARDCLAPDDQGNWLDPAKILPVPAALAGTRAERDWQNANWGTSALLDFKIVSHTETDFEATFATAWVPAHGIYHELARRFPELKIVVSAVEEGQEVSYRFEAHRNSVKEDSPGLTEELVEEVSGEPIKISDFYLRPAEPRAMPATRLRLRSAEQRIKRELATYQVYMPPHQRIEMAMSQAAADENFAYFMSQRENRIEHLRSLLGRFQIGLEFSDPTKRALDRWIAEYGAFLYIAETGSSFLTYTPAWRDVRVGWNVIFDIAIFLGEFAIRESPTLHWQMNTDVPSGMRKTDEAYRKPIIVGFPERPRWRLDLMTDVHRICHALREASSNRKPRMKVLPRKLNTDFASLTLLKVRLEAQGDYEAANTMMHEAMLAEAKRHRGLIARLFQGLTGR